MEGQCSRNPSILPYDKRLDLNTQGPLDVRHMFERVNGTFSASAACRHDVIGGDPTTVIASRSSSPVDQLPQSVDAASTSCLQSCS